MNTFGLLRDTIGDTAPLDLQICVTMTEEISLCGCPHECIRLLVGYGSVGSTDLCDDDRRNIIMWMPT